MTQIELQSRRNDPVEDMPNPRGSLERIPLARWQEFVNTQPERTIFHHARWLSLISKQYKFPAHIYAWVKAGEVMAGLPFLGTSTLRRQRKLVSLPFTDNLRVLGSDAESLLALRDGLKATNFSSYYCVVNKTDQPLGFSCTPSGIVRHELDLTRSMSEIERGYARSLKSNLRKGQKANLQFSVSQDAAALDTFYQIHVKTRHRLGIPVQPRSFFNRLYRELIATGLGFVATVSHQGDPVSVGVFLVYGKTMVFKYAASELAALHLRPNDFLVGNAICDAVDRSLDTFDFGTSREVETGLRRFKRKWGATEYPLFNDCVVGNVAINRSDSLAMTFARATIRHTPSIVCRTAGKILYRYNT
ncbi:FemAB family protein [Planctomycetes bacterium CA13]|uniref:FemAB family protein n=1 Tax=Novipirellula herctigrandis TaxID=2527986 RepID=A0A5C5Z6A7_9BACT|nr:FemAB family protein [Planctomycetes bacterium CA13]